MKTYIVNPPNGGIQYSITEESSHPEKLVLVVQGADQDLINEFFHFIAHNRLPENRPRAQVRRFISDKDNPSRNNVPKADETYLNGNIPGASLFNTHNKNKVHVLDTEDEVLREINSEIEKNLDNEGFKISQIARKIGLCDMQLYRKIKKRTRLSPANYVRKYRLHRSVEFLRKNKYSISQAGFMTGFRSLEYFSRSFKKEFGVCPSVFRKQFLSRKEPAE